VRLLPKTGYNLPAAISSRYLILKSNYPCIRG
jgi:hypothetical protein